MASGKRRRDPGKERFWRGVMRRQRRGGLSVREFCEREGLKEWSFHWWRRELDKRDGEQPASPAVSSARRASSAADGAFVPVQLLPEQVADGTDIEIVLPGGATLRVPCGFDSQTLERVLSVLEGRRC